MRIGEQAVKAHISRLFLKFRVESRAGLAVVIMNRQLGERSEAAAKLAELAETEHREAVQMRARLLATLVGKAPTVVIDSTARVLLANPAFQRIFAAALYQDEQGVKLPADAEPLTKVAAGAPAVLRFQLASGPRKGSWWHATSEPATIDGGGAIVVFQSVPGPRRGARAPEDRGPGRDRRVRGRRSEGRT